ncbi:SusC/RagA family TonB-linked outer membrane protein [Bacteroidia bacterium]|nr:SusC/RagA family TonB-linked outer membrane protein [Bacteroidia bacterium]
MPGANIVVTGTKTVAISDVKGAFSIPMQDGAASLTVSYIGYQTQVVNIQGKNEVSIILQTDNFMMDEVVVVGYGTQKKVHLTGSVSAVSGKEITKRNAQNLSAAMQGLMPGVTVIQASGRPGADGGEITIRGRGSVNSSTTPLILVDGVEGDINAVDMNAVESISVLKDAASASIYGSRAANGVILITTKRGENNSFKISYNGYVTINEPTTLMEPLSAVEYMQYINEANRNTNGADASPVFAPSKIDEYIKYGADGFYDYDTDWRKEMLKKVALTHKHALTLQGGSDIIKYYIGGSYYFQDGLIDNTNFNRKTLRFNTDSKLASWVKLVLDLNFRNNVSEVPVQATPEQLIGAALTYNPTLGGINPDGTWGEGLTGYNPIAIAKAGGTQQADVTEVSGKASLSLTPFKNFEILARYNVRGLFNETTSFVRPYDTYVQGAYKSTYSNPPSIDGGKRNESWQKTIASQFEFITSYNIDISKHQFKLLAGMQVEDTGTKYVNASRTGYSVPGYEELASGSKGIDNGSTHYEWALASYMGRLNYNYAEKYLLEINARYDGSSRFARGHRWGLFPGVSLGWRISEEAFFEPAKQIFDNLKIRLSYGQLGNQWLTSSSRGANSYYYPYVSTIYTSAYEGYFFNDVQYLGSEQREMYNEMISWEKSTQYNAGIDITLLNKRLDMSFDVFRRIISDLIQEPDVPAFVGYKSALLNAGELQNTGWDLSLTWKDRIGNVGYRASFVLSDVSSVLTKSYTATAADGANIVKVGLPLNAWYGYRTAGFYQSEQEILDWPAFYNDRANIKVGDIKYIDISGPEGVPDGTINAYDREVLADRYPRYEYSLNLSADWKNFDISFFLQGVGKKGVRYAGVGAEPFRNGRNIFRHQLDYWREDNRNAKFPRLTMPSTSSTNNYYISDFWVQNGAYLRLKNMVIGYTLPKQWTTKIGISSARCYISGQNLFTLSHVWEGYDPESYSYDAEFYPIMRTYTFGIDIHF